MLVIESQGYYNLVITWGDSDGEVFLIFCLSLQADSAICIALERWTVELRGRSRSTTGLKGVIFVSPQCFRV